MSTTTLQSAYDSYLDARQRFLDIEATRLEQREKAIEKRASWIAESIARSPQKRAEHGSGQWGYIKVDAFGVEVDYYEAADIAQELASFGDPQRAAILLRRRFDALVGHIERTPVVLAMASDELDREAAAELAYEELEA